MAARPLKKSAQIRVISVIREAIDSTEHSTTGKIRVDPL